MKIPQIFTALLLCCGGVANADSGPGDGESSAIGVLTDSLGLEASAVPARNVSAGSDAGREDRWLIARENLRRYVEGEALLSVVDVQRG